MTALPALLPWMAPQDAGDTRFVLLLPSLLLMGKTWELAVNRPRRPESFGDWKTFCVWALFPPEGRLCLDVQSKEEARRHGTALMTRAFAKLCGFVALLVLNEQFSFDDLGYVSIVWMAFLMYFALGGVVDGIGAIGGWFGVHQTGFLNAPVVASNPRDFWGRRWNLWFSQTGHRLIFQPLGGKKRPILAASAVFGFSALMHEYMVYVSLQRFDGRMLIFFAVHGVATMLYTLYARGPGRSISIPKPVAVGMHLIWFVAAGPLFFGPVNDIFGLTSWTVSAVLGS